MAREILTASHPGIEDAPLRVAPVVSSEFNLVRAFLIPKACFKVEDAHFAFDSSFIAPEEFDVGPLKDLLDKNPGTKLSIFGHADPTGDETYNKTLSGRRASAVFGLLTRDVAIWEKLHDHAAGGDNWKPHADETMRATTGLPAGAPLKALIKAYMDKLCTVPGKSVKVELTKDDFLARGAGANGKGDFQGCSEFNPLMIFSKDEKALLDKKENHGKRNEQNQVNRRVMVLLFRAGSQVDPNRWPCPTVDEGVAKCKARFHSDGETRRSNQALHREFKDTKDTFACRFYDRISNSSPCEVPVPPPPKVTVASLEATLESTQNAATKARPAAGNFTTSNQALDFAAASGDLMVVIRDSGEITVKALTIQPPTEANRVRWQIERNPADTVESGLPGLDKQSGAEVKITPNKAGSFRLICFRDDDGNGKHDAGEELRVLRFVIVKITPQAGGTLTTKSVFNGVVDGVKTGPGRPMTLKADFLLEGGGADRRFGLDQVVLNNIGNLNSDNFTVNYPPTNKDKRAGTEEEDPDFKIDKKPGFPSPMVDTVNVKQGKEPTGGDTPQRGNSVETILGNGPGGNGQLRQINSLDAPAFGWHGNHPKTGNLWATTQGNNAFQEWVLAHTVKFKKNYTALGTGTWTVNVIGTRAADGTWVNNGSTVTGTPWTIAGFPKTADAAGAQVLGFSFVNEFGMIAKP